MNDDILIATQTTVEGTKTWPMRAHLATYSEAYEL